MEVSEVGGAASLEVARLIGGSGVVVRESITGTLQVCT